MNQGQEQFFNFIIERVIDGKQDEARALLTESFELQAKNEFTPEQLATFVPKMLALLKPECVEEVKSIMQQFGSRHTN